MKALIIDDEALARRELRTLLRAHPEIEIVGEAGNVTEALQLLEAEPADLIFLDIQMPGRSGFDLIGLLPSPQPQVIFVTAYDEFALRAFEVNALDYLMKPVHPERLAAALRKLQAGTASDEALPAAAAAEIPLNPEDRVFLREGERCWFVPVKEIRLLESAGNHTMLHFGTDKAMIYRTLNSMEARLPASLFFRANRSQMLNLHQIAGVEPWFSGCLKVRLQSGEEIELSRRQSQLFRDRTGL